MKNKHSIHTSSFAIVVVLALILAITASACSPQQTAAQDDAAVNAETVAAESEPTEEPTVIPPTATFAPTFTSVPTEAIDQQDNASSGATDTQAESTAAPAVIGASTLTTLSNVNVRACPAVTCDIVGSFGGGATVNGLEMVEGGAYGNSVWWWRVQLSGGSGYVHSTFVK